MPGSLPGRHRRPGTGARPTVHLIADVRGAGFPDSAGLGALVGGRRELRSRGGSLTLVADADRVQVLRITGLRGAFAVHSCVRHAITAGPRWQAAISGDGGNAGDGAATAGCCEAITPGGECPLLTSLGI
jgi:hypothetical protein